MSFIQLKSVVVKFFLGVFSGLSSTVFSFVIKATYSRETRHCEVQREERIVHAFACPLAKIWTSKQTQLHRYAISFQLGETVELIAKTPELPGHVTGRS